MTRFLLLAALVPLVAACEHGVDVKGTVRVPVEVQEEFSAEAPGEVFVQVILPGGDFVMRRVGILCAPGTAERSFEVDLFDFACVRPGDATVIAWAAPVVPTRRLACDENPQSSSAGSRDDAIAIGETAVAVEHIDSIGKCDDGRVTLDLALEPDAR